MVRKERGSLVSSFRHAFNGILICLKNERNIRIHFFVSVLVVIAGIVLRISPVEWCICLTLFAVVLSLELMNTAIESTVDLVTQERKKMAKIAKDTAAGAVLIAAIMAAFAGLIIFLPKGVSWIKSVIH